MIKLSRIILISLISLSVLSFAKEIPSNGTFLQSLDWQKIALEKSIADKVRDALSTIVKSNQYVVDIEINVNPPVKPKFTPPEGAGGAGGEDEKKGKIRISDVPPAQMPKDYVVFSKLGLEAPLIDDFDDFQGADDKKKGDNKPKEADLPPFEQLWKYNTAVDIFNNLEGVKIYVKLSEKLHASTRDNIKKVLNSLKFNLNAVTPELEVTYIDMEENYSSIQLPSTLKESLALLGRFANMIGLIMAAILLGIIAFVLYNKWEKMEKEKQEQQAAAAAQNAAPKEEEKEEEKDSGHGPVGPFGQEEGDSKKGAERFIAFMESSPVEAVMLVKKWLNILEKKEKNALRALVHHLNNDSLLEIFKKLTDDEREAWKSLLDTQIAAADLPDTNAFISNAIVEDILVPSDIVDAEVADLLLRLKPEKAAAFVKDHPNLGKILMNVMNSKFVAKILDSMEEDTVDLALNRSLEYKKEEIQGLLGDFKNKLKGYQITKSRIPFLAKIMDLIPLSMPTRENALFKALASNSENVEDVSNVAMQFFPAILIPHLPENFLKTTLQAYPIGKKIELVSSIDENLREKFVNIFAPAGSKAADVLELELEKVETDLAIQRRIREQSDLIWKEFVDFTRKMIKANKENASDFENMVNQWAEKIMAGESPEQAAGGIDHDRTSTKSLKAA